MLVLDDYMCIYKCNISPVKWPEVDPPLITLGVIHILYLLWGMVRSLGKPSGY